MGFLKAIGMCFGLMGAVAFADTAFAAVSPTLAADLAAIADAGEQADALQAAFAAAESADEVEAVKAAAEAAGIPAAVITSVMGNVGNPDTGPYNPVVATYVAGDGATGAAGTPGGRGFTLTSVGQSGSGGGSSSSGSPN